MVGPAGVYLELVRFAADAAADNAQHVAHRLHVLQVGHVRDFGNTLGKEGRRHHGEHGVLRSRNLDFAFEGFLYLVDFKTVHY